MAKKAKGARASKDRKTRLGRKHRRDTPGRARPKARRVPAAKAPSRSSSGKPGARKRAAIPVRSSRQRTKKKAKKIAKSESAKRRKLAAAVPVTPTAPKRRKPAKPKRRKPAPPAPKRRKPAPPAPKPYKRPIPLRVVPVSAGTPTGVLGPTGRTPKRDRRPDRKKRRLSKSERAIEAIENRLRNALAKIRQKKKAAERKRALRKIRRPEILNRVRTGLEWLQVIQTRANQYQHKTIITQAVNRDSTADLQLLIGTWPKPYKEAVQNLIFDIRELLPTLDPGLKLRTQVRLRASTDAADRMRFAYLPMTEGAPTVYFNYVDPRTAMTQLFTVMMRIEDYTKKGWLLDELAFDVRFDPAWIEGGESGPQPERRGAAHRQIKRKK